MAIHRAGHRAHLAMMRQALQGFLMLGLAACGPPHQQQAGEDPQGPGAAIFRMECIACHGRDGTLGMGGAKNLARSPLSREEMIAVVTQGKGVMPGFKAVLSPGEIGQVVDHVRALHVDH